MDNKKAQAPHQTWTLAIRNSPKYAFFSSEHYSFIYIGDVETRKDRHFCQKKHEFALCALIRRGIEW